MCRRMHHGNARYDGPIFLDDFKLTVFFYVFDEILQVAKIQRMQVVNGGKFLFMHIDSGIDARVIIFAVIVVQMKFLFDSANGYH